MLFTLLHKAWVSARNSAPNAISYSMYIAQYYGIHSDIIGKSMDCNILPQTHETVVLHTCMCSYTSQPYTLEYSDGIYGTSYLDSRNLTDL